MCTISFGILKKTNKMEVYLFTKVELHLEFGDLVAIW